MEILLYLAEVGRTENKRCLPNPHINCMGCLVSEPAGILRKIETLQTSKLCTSVSCHLEIGICFILFINSLTTLNLSKFKGFANENFNIVEKVGLVFNSLLNNHFFGLDQIQTICRRQKNC